MPLRSELLTLFFLEFFQSCHLGGPGSVTAVLPLCLQGDEIVIRVMEFSLIKYLCILSHLQLPQDIA